MGRVLGAALMLVGCAGDGGDAEVETVAMDTAMMASQSDTNTMAMGGGVQGPPQDPDHELLRMMSDHHKGLEVLGAEAMARAVDDSVQSAAHNLHTKPAAEQDTMVAMIQRMYNERYPPTTMPKNAAQVDSLQQVTGADADRYFLQTTIAHHEEAIQMIDRFLPRSTKPEVRQRAERMRENQLREIQGLQSKLDEM